MIELGEQNEVDKVALLKLARPARNDFLRGGKKETGWLVVAGLPSSLIEKMAESWRREKRDRRVISQDREAIYGP